MKNITVKIPKFGLAIAKSEKDWGDSIGKNNDLDGLYNHILDFITRALNLQQVIGRITDPIRSEEDDVATMEKKAWDGNPQYQLLLMKFEYKSHKGSIVAVLIPTMGDEENIEYAASVMLDDYKFFHALTESWGGDPEKMAYDESVSLMLPNLDHPIVDHIRSQIDRYETDLKQAIKEDRILLDDDTIDSIEKKFGAKTANMFRRSRK